MKNSNVSFSSVVEWVADACLMVYPQLKRPSSRQILNLIQATQINHHDILPKDMIQFQGNILSNLFIEMDLDAPKWTNQIDETKIPLLSYIPETGWGIIIGKSPDGKWKVNTPAGHLMVTALPAGALFASVELKNELQGKVTARSIFYRALMANNRLFTWVALAALFGNLLALAGSLYSMQVYDRVLPTENISTLIVLMVGTIIAAFTEFIIKLSRQGILEFATKTMDLSLSDQIFKRLLQLRMDQFPASIGTLSSQIRGYETIRGFMSTATMFFAIDTPFALIFLVVILLLAGPIMAAIPLFFLVISLLIGIFYRKKIAAHGAMGNNFSNKKVGLLVETIENAESIKAYGANWLLSSRWSILERSCAENTMFVRRYSEHAGYFSAFLQQVSYIVLVSTGSYLTIVNHDLTMGTLIACSILSGRILAPVASLPGLMVQWAHAQAALGELEKMYSLETDNYGVTNPLTPEKMSGNYHLNDLVFSYPGRPETLRLDKLQIKQGEKIAILGAVGAGKSTLLKLLSGLYRPARGRVLLDGLDIQQIARSHLSEHIGYYPQNTRLLAGTLRDNLLAGLFGIKENEIMDACRLTGLDVAIASHPQGLNMEIAEGGIGLSTGQKQLVTLTRMILSKPSIWLLDEPTASMDDASELRCIQALQTSIKQDQTVVIVTHKPALLSLVDRIIIIGATGIIRDGAKNELVRTRTLKPVQESVTMVHNGNKSSVSKVFTNPEKPINDNSSQSSVSGDTA